MLLSLDDVSMPPAGSVPYMTQFEMVNKTTLVVKIWNTPMRHHCPQKHFCQAHVWAATALTHPRLISHIPPSPPPPYHPLILQGSSLKIRTPDSIYPYKIARALLSKRKRRKKELNHTDWNDLRTDKHSHTQSKTGQRHKVIQWPLLASFVTGETVYFLFFAVQIACFLK